MSAIDDLIAQARAEGKFDEALTLLGTEAFRVAAMIAYIERCRMTGSARASLPKGTATLVLTLADGSTHTIEGGIT